MSEHSDMLVELEWLRDETARERLARRDAERWLEQIQETFRPYWEDYRSPWDGSLCGLPAELVRVVQQIEELRSTIRELVQENAELRQEIFRIRKLL